MSATVAASESEPWFDDVPAALPLSDPLAGPPAGAATPAGDDSRGHSDPGELAAAQLARYLVAALPDEPDDPAATWPAS
ncbi:MAG: hypothetical protein AAGC55_31130, partial [Myxococcota bacterium]